ncbi:type II toxin-antitoxin system RelE/ParE family toxin [Candidatus Dependentiae bacterium]|nr:type II toxin-antitoxin system RelE/ParE family toxin [Alphaproteobacteria bacterium]MBM3887325.1 type II toxin-antitoxin system RelE/ParE family toxin [Candidatus Dependentiae bacterium]
MNFHLTTRALEDLRDIATYTEEVWGVKQRNFYLGKLDEAFHLIAKSPQSGKNGDHIRFGYFRYRAASI